MKDKIGKFIVLEGIDGCGKDTQQKMLESFVSSDDGEGLGEFVFFHVLDEDKKHTNALRDAMFNSGIRWSTMSEMLMFWADKFETILLIKKAVEEGKNVVMNRWELSNLAYQIYGKGAKEHEEFARLMQEKLDATLRPDLYVLFDVSVQESGRRMALRKGEGYDRDDYYESQKKDFFERVILGYKTEIQKYNYVIINGEQPKEKVFEDTLKEIKAILAQW